MVNETSATGLSDFQRRESINEVSQLSQWFAWRRIPILQVCSQKAVERTPTKRTQAHRKLLREVRRDLEGMREKEQVICLTNKSQTKITEECPLLQIATDAKVLLKRYKKLCRR